MTLYIYNITHTSHTHHVLPAQAGIQAFKTLLNHHKEKPLKSFYVYIMASKRNGTLYTGVTSDLAKRVWQHKSKEVPGFTAKYKVHQLVYYEIHDSIIEAIQREKNIQAWKRSWKLQLIEKDNPTWNDLYETLD